MESGLIYGRNCVVYKRKIIDLNFLFFCLMFIGYLYFLVISSLSDGFGWYVNGY